MDSENVVEWSYENFSCWDCALHGKCLSYKYSPFDLYPRGLNGNEDNLIVKVHDVKKSSRVELSFIGADGSVICKIEVQDPKWRGGSFILPSGPKFEAVIRTVKNNRDVLTLRLYRSDNDWRNHGRTTIDVLEECLKIPPLVFKGMHMAESLWISCLSFDRGGHNYNLDLNARLVGSTLNDANLSIALFPYFTLENFVIRAYVLLLDDHDVVIKSADGMKKFCDVDDKSTWTIPTAFSLKEVYEQELHLTLCVKFVFKDVRNVYSLPSIKHVESSSVKPFISSGNGENLTNVVVVPSDVVSPGSVPMQELKCLH